MARYRKKPVEIDAVPIADALASARHTWDDLPAWLTTAYDNGDVLFLDNAILISTLEGQMRGEHGDWLVRGVQGELYPVKPGIFEATYEPVV
jgi:hypothetical protein